MTNQKTGTVIIIIAIVFVLFTLKYLAPSKTVVNIPVAPIVPTVTAVVNEDVLGLVQKLTSPMVWSTPKTGTILDAAGNDVSGLIMEAKMADKSNNTISPLLVSDSIFIVSYGWKEDPSGIANGMGQGIYTLQKTVNGKVEKMIFRTGSGKFVVLSTL